MKKHLPEEFVDAVKGVFFKFGVEESIVNEPLVLKIPIFLNCRFKTQTMQN
jgi:hypothetical protein